MASRTVKDIIDRVREIHHELGNYYQSSSDAAARDRVKMLLQYLSRHEKNLAQAMTDYQNQASDAIMKTWFKNTPNPELLRGIDDVKITPDMTAEEVTRQVLNIDDKLLEAFRELARDSVSQEVKDLFLRLIALEEREEHRLVRDAIELEDV